MAIPFKSDYVVERVLVDAGSETLKVESTAGLRLSPLAAREVWPQVLEHKWYMSERLGRDGGPRAAALDYFANIREAPKRDEVCDTLPPTPGFMRPFGYR